MEALDSSALGPQPVTLGAEKNKIARELCASTRNRRRIALDLVNAADNTEKAWIVMRALERYASKRQMFHTFITVDAFFLYFAFLVAIGVGVGLSFSEGSGYGLFAGIMGANAVAVGALFWTTRTLKTIEQTLREALDMVTDTRVTPLLMTFAQRSGKQVCRPALVRLLSATAPDELAEWNSQERRLLNTAVESPNLAMLDPELMCAALPRIAVTGNRETLRQVLKLQVQLNGMSRIYVAGRKAQDDVLVQLRVAAADCSSAIADRLAKETARQTLLRGSSCAEGNGSGTLLRAATSNSERDAENLLRATD